MTHMRSQAHYRAGWWPRLQASGSTLYLSLPLISGNLLALVLPNPLPAWAPYALVGLGLTLRLGLQLILPSYQLRRLQAHHLEVPLLLLIGFCLHQPRFPNAALPPLPEKNDSACYLEVELRTSGHPTTKYQRYTASLMGYYLDTAWHAWPTQLTLYVPKHDTAALHLLPGQRYLVRGKPYPIQDSSNDFFSYRSWATHHGLAGIVYTNNANLHLLPAHPPSFSTRIALSHQHAIAKLRAAGLPEGTLGPVVAMAIGDRSTLTAEMNASFRNSGIAHILAISGFHVGIVYSVLYLLTQLLAQSNAWAYALRNALPVLCIWLFALYCGLAPSIVRASIVVTLYALGKLLQAHQGCAEVYFASAACAMAMDPIAPVDVGFFLSFLAVAGILIFLPFFSSVLHTGHKWLDRFLVLLLVSLAAQLGTLPLVLAAFSSLPVVGILASVPASLLAYPIVVLGLAIVLLPTGCLVARLLGYPLGWSAKGLIDIGQFGSALNPASLTQLQLPLALIGTLSLSIGLFGLYAVYRHPGAGWGSLGAFGLSLALLAL